MRKALLFAPMLMLLLTACGGGGEKVDPAAELQAQYAALGSATMEADVICHYAGEIRTYTLLCAYTPAESTVTVLSPANLSGISATVADGKLHLNYEDISLDAGGYSAAAISPVAALPRLRPRRRSKRTRSSVPRTCPRASGRTRHRNSVCAIRRSPYSGR